MEKSMKFYHFNLLRTDRLLFRHIVEDFTLGAYVECQQTDLQIGHGSEAELTFRPPVPLFLQLVSMMFNVPVYTFQYGNIPSCVSHLLTLSVYYIRPYCCLLTVLLTVLYLLNFSHLLTSPTVYLLLFSLLTYCLSTIGARGS